MAYVIRSMSTTDYRPAYRGAGNVIVPAQLPEPYHVYLMPVEKRTGAYWSKGAYYGMQFDTVEQAQAEIDRCGLDHCDIAPIDHERTGFPTYWDRRDVDRAREKQDAEAPADYREGYAAAVAGTVRRQMADHDSGRQALDKSDDWFSGYQDAADDMESYLSFKQPLRFGLKMEARA